MTRRLVSVMAVCAAALGIVVGGGGAAQAAVVCETVSRNVGAQFVHVTLCMNEYGETVAVGARQGGNADVEVVVDRWHDPSTGESGNEVRVCSSQFPPEFTDLVDGGCIRLL